MAHETTVKDLSESAKLVQAALKAAGIDAAVVELPASTRTAADAAAAIGCDVRQIAKSLVFRRVDSGAPVMVIASGANRVDEARLAQLVETRIEKSDADFVRRETGFAIGGIPPVRHLKPIEILIDRDLLD